MNAHDRSSAEAAAAAAQGQGAKFIAGGTNLLDLMKLEIETPTHLIDVNGLPARQNRTDGRRRATHRRTRSQHRTWPPISACVAATAVLTRALVPAPSGQIRNMATTAGNLLQRTPMPLFLRHQSAMQQTRSWNWLRAQLAESVASMAVIGVSDACIATHPSDMAWHRASSTPWWKPFDRMARCGRSPSRTSIVCQGDQPHIETVLDARRADHGCDVAQARGGAQIYHKVRDRASYAFALISVAAIVHPRRNGAGGTRRGGASSRGESKRRRPKCPAAPRQLSLAFAGGRQANA